MISLWVPSLNYALSIHGFETMTYSGRFQAKHNRIERSRKSRSGFVLFLLRPLHRDISMAGMLGESDRRNVHDEH